MTSSLTFTVYGKPEGWHRARVSSRGAKPRLFNDPKTEAAENRVCAAAQAAWEPRWPPRYPGAVRVSVYCYFARPERLKRKKDRGTTDQPYTGKPDADNIVKAVLDGITRSGRWKDDTQVSDLTVRRRYLDLDNEGNEIDVPRMVVTVTALDSA